MHLSDHDRTAPAVNGGESRSNEYTNFELGMPYPWLAKPVHRVEPHFASSSLTALSVMRMDSMVSPPIGL